MVERTWHSDALCEIAAAAAADPAVSELWVHGSAATGDLDEWSDLDVALVVPVEDVHKVASPDWLGFLGHAWTYQVTEGDGAAGVRVVYRDGRWVDLLAVGASERLPAVRRQVELPDSPTGRVTGPAAVSRLPELPAQVYDFRFIAALAVAKDARDDLLIGGHLALQLPRACLELAMLLRDRETGTTHHRHGGPGNEVLERVLDLIPEEDSGRDSVLDLVDASAGLFDELAARVWRDYASDWAGLTVLLDRARAR
jgi:hypothetical protein